MEQKVSVIIPAFNEEENIANVIAKSKESKYVGEIIVINNRSSDNTEEIAKKEGAIVIECEQQGKGYAMEKGIEYARNEIVVFLDADVKYDKKDVIESLIKPILEEKADFVKSTFERTIGGKVTEIAVKPLLNIVYPDMYKFSEPISGMIASKKNILEKLEFEKDYGVDIGILIDVIQMNCLVKEVNIGKIENMSHTCKNIDTMRNMSTEVMKAILKRVNK